MHRHNKYQIPYRVGVQFTLSSDVEITNTNIIYIYFFFLLVLAAFSKSLATLVLVCNNLLFVAALCLSVGMIVLL